MNMLTINCTPAVKKSPCFQFLHSPIPDSPCLGSTSLITSYPSYCIQGYPTEKGKTCSTLQHTVSAVQKPDWHSAWSIHHKHQGGLALKALLVLQHVSLLKTNTVLKRPDLKTCPKYCCLLPFLHIRVPHTPDSSMRGTPVWPEPLLGLHTLLPPAHWWTHHTPSSHQLWSPCVSESKNNIFHDL